jgi:tetratricopeptide (TPR) repeat protein
MSIQEVPSRQASAGKATRAVALHAHVFDASGHLSGTPSRWSRIVSALLNEGGLIRMALLLVFGLYVRAVGFAPVYDDNVITPWTSLRDVPKFFTHDIFGFDGSAHSVYYRPLAETWGFLVSLATGGAPGWLHLSAILLHVAVVILAYVFGRHLFGDQRLALLTAVLFGLHPSKVESVVWIGSSCVDGLGAVFFFASLITLFKWREGGYAGWQAASVFLFAAAMFTKETMVFIPILIAAYLCLMTPAAGRISRVLRVLLPYGVVWIVYMAIRHQVIKPASAGAEYIHPTFTLSNLWTAPYAIWWYIGHLVFPWGLSVEYAAKILQRPTLLGFVFPAACLLLLLAAAWWMWRRQRSKMAAFLIFWFVLTLAPAVIVAPMVLQHDRYLHIPSFAFCALVAWAILHLANAQIGSLRIRTRVVAALCVVALWTGLSWHEMGYWDCDTTLWTRVLQISPSEPKAQIQLAFIYQQAGDTPRALAILNDGLRYRPNSPNLWLVRARMLYDDKRWDEAGAAFLKVLQVTEPAPGQAVSAGPPTRLRAAAAYHLALMDISANNFPEAERYVRLALSMNANGVGYHSTLSQCLRGEGRIEEAKAENALELRLRLAQQAAHP